ncbi:hypothetical protein [Desmospora profundinema]|uniref:ABC transporter permease n=1 Tax=Desmospora profundinema TaxID=1571184 RepID=A0ABU1IMX1_9BACL|nr:hypothetical protein [Desmospora profundinema]MDR6226130.1 hypothetical protein [Desmospora profundinema]
MKKSLKISKLMLKIWKREVGRILDTRIKVTAAAAVLFAMASLAALGGYQITSATLVSFLHGDTQNLTLLTVSMYLNASILVSLFFVVFKAITPDQDQLSVKLSWFPVTRFERNLGYFIPFVSIVLTLVLFIISIILLPAFIIQQVGWSFGFAFFAGLLLQAFFTLSLIQLLYNGIHFLMTTGKLPFGKFFTLFLVIVSIVYYAMETLSIEGMLETFTSFDYHAAYLVSPLMLLAIGELSAMEVNLFLIFVIWIGVVVASFGSLFLVRVRTEKRSPKLLRLLPIPRAKFGALFVKEIKSQIRSEENLLNFFLVAVMVLFVNLQFDLWGNEILLWVLAAIVGMVAMNSFGHDKKMIALYKIFDVKPYTAATAKTMGLWILAAVQLLIFCALTLTIPASGSGWQIAWVAVNSTALFYLTGTLIPLDKNSPHIGLLSFLFLLILLVPMVFIGNYLTSHAPQAVQAGALITAELLLVAAIFASHHWRFNHE